MGLPHCAAAKGPANHNPEFMLLETPPSWRGFCCGILLQRHKQHSDASLFLQSPVKRWRREIYYKLAQLGAQLAFILAAWTTPEIR